MIEIKLTDVSAMQMWRYGHHAFFVLTQGMIILWALTTEALRQEQWETARHHLRLSIRLMDASGLSMVLSANFSKTDYEEIVRPSMHPPACPTELSGVMSSDHLALMTELAALRTQLELAGDPIADIRQDFLEALSGLYKHHIQVCERFVARAPSLRGAAETSAIHVLERIRDRRLGLAGQSSRA